MNLLVKQTKSEYLRLDKIENKKEYLNLNLKTGFKKNRSQKKKL